MAKPGQKIVKGMLPQFPNIGQAKEEKGVCVRCGKKPQKGTKLIQQEAKLDGVVVKRKMCAPCVSTQERLMGDLPGRMRQIETEAMERFRRRK